MGNWSLLCGLGLGDTWQRRSKKTRFEALRCEESYLRAS